MATITATVLGSIAANTGVYSSSEVDSLLSDLTTTINGKLTSAMHYKGTKETVAALEATTDAEVGDLWNVTATDDNYAWNGTTWDKLAHTYTLPDYLANTTLEGKYLQIANADTYIGTTLGYAKTTEVTSAISTALASYTTTANLDTYIGTTLGYAKTTEVNSAISTALASYTKTADLDTYVGTTLGYAKTTAVTAAVKAVTDRIDAGLTTLAEITVPTRTTVTLYEVYDFAKAVYDAVEDMAAPTT